MHLVVEKGGKPLWVTTTGANGNEREQALILLEELQRAQCKNNETLTVCEADKGYDSDDTRQEMLYRGYLPIIGYRKNRKKRVETRETYEFFNLEKCRWGCGEVLFLAEAEKQKGANEMGTHSRHMGVFY